MAKRRMGIMICLICFCLYLVPGQVQAISTSDAKEPISTDKECALTVTYRCEEAAFSELPVKLYKIAEVSADYQYTRTASFENSGLILNGIQSAGEWNVIRSTLETYILAYGVEADQAAVTNQEGQASFEALKPGLYLAITEPVTKDGWKYVFDSALVALPGLNTDGFWQYQVAVTAKFQMIPTGETDEEKEHKVIKLWKGDDGKTDRPQSIQVEIFRDGASYETVTLSEENHWTYSWSAKDDGAIWNVVERNVPSGYTMTVEQRENSFVLTNTWDNPDKPTPPQTGETANVLLYVIIMNISGIMLVVLGMTGKRKRA